MNYDISSDLRTCCSENGLEVQEHDIKKVVLTIEGENDCRDWHWIVKLNDDRWAYIHGGCDYTGWDCQCSGEVFIAKTKKQVLTEVPQDERRVFEDMIRNKEHAR
jgi:hypothetical protein